MTYLEGIDISEHQSVTPSLKGLDFAFVRASIGDHGDTMYQTHIANVHKAGILLGAYHFGRTQIYGGTPGIQAARFLAAAVDAAVLALDVESDVIVVVDPNTGLKKRVVRPPMSQAEAKAFIKAVHAQGRKIGLYHSQSGFFDAGQDWNWKANWSATPPKPWAFWQYGTSTIAPGIDGDRFDGTVDQLYAIAGLTPPDTSTGADMDKFSVVFQWWTASDADAVLRDDTDRAKVPVMRLPGGTQIPSVGEWVDPATNINWRKTSKGLVEGTSDRTPLYFIRTAPGIPADHDFIAGPFGTLVPNPPPAPAPSQTVTVTGQNITVVGP